MLLLFNHFGVFTLGFGFLHGPGQFLGSGSATTELGNPLPVFHFYHMLETPDLLRQRYIQYGPWYAPLYYAVTIKRICQVIRDLYKINENSADQARTTIEAGLQKLEQHLHSRTYLAGDQFTRADLSVAA